MVSAEACVGFGGVILIGFGEDILAPCVPRVLCDRRDPDSIDTEVVEESFFNLAGYAGEVSTLVVHYIEHFGGVEFPVVGRVTVVEAVHEE